MGAVNINELSPGGRRRMFLRLAAGATVVALTPPAIKASLKFLFTPSGVGDVTTGQVGPTAAGIGDPIGRDLTTLAKPIDLADLDPNQTAIFQKLKESRSDLSPFEVRVVESTGEQHDFRFVLAIDEGQASMAAKNALTVSKTMLMEESKPSGYHSPYDRENIVVGDRQITVFKLNTQNIYERLEVLASGNKLDYTQYTDDIPGETIILTVDPDLAVQAATGVNTVIEVLVGAFRYYGITPNAILPLPIKLTDMVVNRGQFSTTIHITVDNTNDFINSSGLIELPRAYARGI